MHCHSECVYDSQECITVHAQGGLTIHRNPVNPTMKTMTATRGTTISQASTAVPTTTFDFFTKRLTYTLYRRIHTQLMARDFHAS